MLECHRKDGRGYAGEAVRQERSSAQIEMPNHKTRTLATVLYLLTTSFLFADQNLLSPSLSLVAEEFGFDDLERDRKLGGDISVAFYMIGVPAAMVVGCLADVVERRSLLFLVTVLIGEGSCCLTYFVRTYGQLFWLRALTGCSVGGAVPLIYSVLSDLYGPVDRGWVSGTISMSCGFGIAIGQGASGFLSPRWGWRLPFLVVSIPAMIGAVLVWLCAPEVKRGGAEAGLERRREHESAVELAMTDPIHEQKDSQLGRKPSSQKLIAGESPKLGLYVQLENIAPDSSTASIAPNNSNSSNQIWRSGEDAIRSIHPQCNTLVSLLKCRSVLLAIMQGAPGCVPWGVINAFLNDYLSSDRNLSVEGSTLVILLFGIGNFAGTLAGGLGCSYLYQHYGARAPSVLSSTTTIAACVPLWALVNVDFNSADGKPHYLFLGSVSVVAGALSGVTGPIVKATLQNVTLPTSRGQAFALLNILDDFGRGLGPAFVALLIERLGGRRRAFNVGITGWILCGVLNGLLFFTVESDEEIVRMAAQRQIEKDEADCQHNRGNNLELL